MKRLLCIVGGMNAGGAETFLMKIYRSIDREKYQMDFYVATQEKGFYDDEILSMGGRIFRSVPKSEGFVKSFKALRRTVKENSYDRVLRVSQHSISVLDLLAAKAGGAKLLAYRSSNTGTGGGRINRMLHRIFLFLSIMVPDVKLAPSTEAAEFMFGRGCVERGAANVLNNGIPLDVFGFKQEMRTIIRNELNLGDRLVIGHVGRFNQQKNHKFLVRIFSEVVKRDPESRLLLVGKGELEADIRELLRKEGLLDRAIFTGVRSDVPDLLSAMDVFVFPSFFEGLPNTVIEAQGAGLPCVIADTITREAKISSIVDYMSLGDSAETWAKKALESATGSDHSSPKDEIRINGYDIMKVSEYFVELLMDR